MAVIPPRYLTALLFSCAAVLLSPAFAADERPCAVNLRDGTRLTGVLHADGFHLTGVDGQVREIPSKEIAGITFSSGAVFKQAAEARKAVQDLRSDNFKTREDADLLLRKLGSAAAGALQAAVKSDDPETAVRANKILEELNLKDAVADTGDSVKLSAGASLSGEIKEQELTLDCAWGNFTISTAALASVEFTAAAPTTAGFKRDEKITIQAPALKDEQSGASVSTFKRWRQIQNDDNVQFRVFNNGNIQNGNTPDPSVETNTRRLYVDFFSLAVEAQKKKAKAEQKALEAKNKAAAAAPDQNTGDKKPDDKPNDPKVAAPNVAQPNAGQQAAAADKEKDDDEEEDNGQNAIAQPFGQETPKGFDNGERLEKYFAAGGLLLRAKDGRVVSTQNSARMTFGHTQVAAADNDVEIRFAPPGTNLGANQIPESAYGVRTFGVRVMAAAAGTVALAAYGRNGKPLGTLYNEGAPIDEGGTAEFMGFTSDEPVMLVKLYRLGDARAEALYFDDFTLGKLIPSDRDPAKTRLWLTDGSRVTGDWSQTGGGDATGTVTFKPDFLPATTKPADVPLASVFRIDFAHALEKPKEEKEPSHDKNDKPAGWPILWKVPHTVTLQDGADLRAWLVSLDDKEAVLILPGGAELKLPRVLLRKVELLPGDDGGKRPTEILALEASSLLAAASGESAPKDAAPDDKPGVILKTKSRGNGGAPQKKKIDKVSAAFSENRMEGAKVISLSTRSGEITVDDGNGDWSFSLMGVKRLIFPVTAQKDLPDTQATKADWRVTLNGGGKFEVALKMLRPDGIKISIEGGEAMLQPKMLESIELIRSTLH